MPTVPEALAIALQHHHAGRLPEAEQIYRQVLRVDPNQIDALHLLGVLAQQVGQNAVAIEYIGRAIALNEFVPDFHHNRAKAYYAAGRYREAAAGYRRAVELKPSFTVAHNNLGLAWSALDQPAEAIISFRRAIECDPDDALAYNNLGDALVNEGKPDEAIECFQKARALDPTFFEAHNNLGNTLSQQGKRDEAIDCLRQAMGMTPDFAASLYNLGNALFANHNLDEAVACYRQAIALDPSFVQAHVNLGLALVEQGALEEAIAAYGRGLALDPTDPSAHSNLALPLLLLGRYEEGWIEYEWRLALAPPRNHPAPRWNGEPAEGETILISCEQGFGDSLHFMRFAELVRQQSRASRVILECQAPLARLFAQNVAAGIEVIAHDPGTDAPPRCDREIPLLSAPAALGLRGPLRISAPYLHADADLRAIWRERLGPRESFRVGLAWQGNPTQARDRVRSIRPEELLPLFEIEQAVFYSLQLQPSGTDASPLTAAGLIDLTEHIQDFADTAALVAELDLVIAVDTSIVHLAGALGRPVWNLLTAIPHWPWGLQGEETPWYPTMRLFRQTKPGEWASVVQGAHEELKFLVGAG